MGAVTNRHERATERNAVDGSPDFDEASGLKEGDGARPDNVGVAAFRGGFLKAGLEGREHGELSGSRCFHFRAQPRFRSVAPIFAVKSNEDGRIGNRHIGFEHQNMESLPGVVDSGNDLVVGQGLDRISAQKIGDGRSVLRRARRVLVGHEREFRVHIDVGPHVLGIIDRSQHKLKDEGEAGLRVDGFNAWRCLQGICRVDNQDPVAMTEQRERLGHLGLPIRRRERSLRGREKWRAKQRAGKEIPEHRMSIADLQGPEAKKKWAKKIRKSG